MTLQAIMAGLGYEITSAVCMEEGPCSFTGTLSWLLHFNFKGFRVNSGVCVRTRWVELKTLTVLKHWDYLGVQVPKGSFKGSSKDYYKDY